MSENKERLVKREMRIEDETIHDKEITSEKRKAKKRTNKARNVHITPDKLKPGLYIRFCFCLVLGDEYGSDEFVDCVCGC